MKDLRKLFTFVFMLLLAAAGWLAWALLLPMQPAKQTFVLLRPGFTTRRIATELKNAGVIRSADAFVIWHYLHRGKSLKAGEYAFEQAANANVIHDRIVQGDVYVRTVTIPEGFNIFDIAQAIEDAGLGSSADFLKVARTDTALVSDLSPKATSLEGFLFPDTYEFTRTQSMHDMAAAMVRRFRKEAQSIGMVGDFGRTVTLASIVEKETAVPDERPIVASVYSNRLEKKIALDADPCVIYAHLLVGTYRGKLGHEELQIKSPYNTYKYPGLPPGPIGNPGRGSLQAAMRPPATGFFYFVSDGNGHHRFARDLEEHNRNVAKLRKTIAQSRLQNASFGR
jgi:peptidoglycan lytic transglycosylase G